MNAFDKAGNKSTNQGMIIMEHSIFFSFSVELQADDTFPTSRKTLASYVLLFE